MTRSKERATDDGAVSSGGHVSGRPRLGISTCLLGEKVRYDGGHKRDVFIVDTLGRFFDWVYVCPEVECGLPIPRESMHLEGDSEDPRLVTTRTKADKTAQMKRWASRRLRELEGEDLVGFIFKSNSPSSGMERVRIYDENGMPRKAGVGIWARAFMERFPLLPVEEDGRLHDDLIRENFIERVFCLSRYRDKLAAGRSRRGLVEFHTVHKLQLMAHSPKHQKEMGRLVASAKGLPVSQLFDEYERMLMDALKLKATPGKNVNVIQHIMGYFRKELAADEKEEMQEILGSYRDGAVPLIVPITLVGHYVRKYAPEYLVDQTYLRPHPLELRLRNHA